MQHVQAGHSLEANKREKREKKAGSVASNYTELIGGNANGLGQGRTGTTRSEVVIRATSYGTDALLYSRANTPITYQASQHT